MPASLSLARIGVHSEKILPWDWPHYVSPASMSPKAAPQPPLRFIYVGAVSLAKGVAECIEAVALLIGQDVQCQLDVLGSGSDLGDFENLVKQRKLTSVIKFHGAVPHDVVLGAMRASDVVIVPSRHEYPEGLPLTIYEALASRTPLVVSDHPMFSMALGTSSAAVEFQAGNAKALASALRAVIDSPQKYEDLSRSSEQAWQAIQCPLEWSGMLSKWLSGSPDDIAQLIGRNLPSQLARMRGQ